MNPLSMHPCKDCGHRRAWHEYYPGQPGGGIRGCRYVRSASSDAGMLMCDCKHYIPASKVYKHLPKEWKTA